MPTFLTHGFVAIGAARLAGVRRRAGLVVALAVGCSILPDADVAAFWLGIPYRAPLGHRGLSHSLAFALLLGVLLAFAGFRRSPLRRRLALAAGFALVTASHGLLDALTNGGLGVAFFAPFDDTRYFLPWRPIQVSPIGIGPFLTARGLSVLATEAVVVWAPLTLLVWLQAGFARRRRRS